jgi:hypothetical protein
MTKSEQAANFIISFCPRVGAFAGTFEANAFLARLAEEMESAAPSILFPERYKEHVAYALDMVAKNWFTSPPAAVA